VQLAFLYGPPGTGKLAVGTELARLTGFKLLHNHLSVNLVSAVFERDSAEWMAMLRRVRRDVLDGAAQNDISLITTSVYRGTPENVAGFQWVLEPIRARGGSVLYVQRPATATSCCAVCRTTTAARSTSSSMRFV